MTAAVGEVRLRPKYAAEHPEIRADLWLSARSVAESIVQRAATARHLSIHRRTLYPAHFEFRGGPPDARRPSARTRLTDRQGRDGEPGELRWV
jgi:hypothetical protein